MTLTITVATPHCVYQSADYRLVDFTNGQPLPSVPQKLVVVNAFRWSATVCFSGVGRTPDCDVSVWLGEIAARIRGHDSFEQLIDELLTADQWLKNVPSPHNRHSFSIGAFVDNKALFVLVSNFERPDGPADTAARSRLEAFRIGVTKPRTFVSGQRQAVTWDERRLLAALARRRHSVTAMYSALADVNRAAASRTHSQTVSEECITTHLNVTGEGGGFVHGIVAAAMPPNGPLPDVCLQELRRRVGSNIGVRQFVIARIENTADYHLRQLRATPDEASVHNNYAVFLNQTENDMPGAEQEFRKAIELDPNFAVALSNLGGLLVKMGRRAEAAHYYERALEVSPKNEEARCSYASLIEQEHGDYEKIGELLAEGIALKPESGRLQQLYGNCCRARGDFDEARRAYERARETGGNQAEVESGYALALHGSGAPLGECIAAYYVALALVPDDWVLKLNLAGLLFIRGDSEQQVRSLLNNVMQSEIAELSASHRLLAQFYLLAQTKSEVAPIRRNLEALLAAGARLEWDVQRQLAVVEQTNPARAARLRVVRDVLSRQMGTEQLVNALTDWV